MPKNNVIKFDNCFQLPNSGLRTYFDTVEKGQSEIYDTPFCRNNGGFSKILADWKPTLDTLVDSWPTLVDFENDLAAKVGPMSVMKPLKERMSDIDSYYKDINVSAAPILDGAVKAVLHEFSLMRGLNVRSQQRTVDLMKKSTNSGSPFFSKRRTVLAKTVPCEITNGMQSLDGGLKTFNYCAVLGWRGQEGGPKPSDVKQRVVWMFPFAVNIEELRVYQPLIESAQRFNLVPAWVSMEAVDERITKLFDTKSDDDVVVCTDFSKFDQHFNPALQNAARSILSGILTPSQDTRYWLAEIFPIKYEIPLAYNYGQLKFGKHGMGSGSGGTNADETLVHRALQYESAIQAKSRLNLNSMCLGDDGIISYPGITVDSVMQSYTSHGLEMNPDKQYVSKHDCVYLRRWHHQNYRVDGVCAGVYSTYRALGRLCEQERYYDADVWSSKMVALRQLSIVENCKNHPLFEQFAQFCMQRDKYRLGIDIPGFLDDIDNIAKGATDLMPDFLGYTKSMSKDAEVGISNWKIVRYLKSQR
nr:RNA-dependent RNA polymerase [Marmot picobirnavirus]